jgi:outer membrane lipoprotein-sorting protein
MRHQRSPSNLPRTRRLTRAVFGLAAVLGIAGSHALAETVPLPRPAPKERGGPAKPALGDITGTVDRPSAAFQAPQAPPTPMLPDRRQRVATEGTFDATQRAQVAKISTYLSSLPTLTGNFVQVEPNGNRTTGEFFMQKPGKVRFAYDPPSPLDIVSDGRSVVVRHRKLNTQDVYPLSRTPLRYLLSDRIDLLKDTNVVSIVSDDVFVTVTIEETDRLIGTQRLMLMIGTRDNQLKQWTIIDPQGNDVTTAVYNLDSQKKPSPDLFNFMKYDDGRGAAGFN